MKSHTVLTVAILISLVVGLIVGEILHQAYDGDVADGLLNWLSFVGDTFFMRLLKMVIVPLVASSVIVGVASIGDPSKLGKVGGATIAYYFLTMLAAVILGLVLVNLLAPGTGLSEDFRQSSVTQFEASPSVTAQRVQGASGSGLTGAFQNICRQFVPSNPISAAANGEILPVISFSLMLGVVLTVIGEAGKSVLRFFDGVFQAMMKLVEWILWLAPIGIACLVTKTVAEIGAGILTGHLAKYIAVVIVGLLLHAAVVLPLILYITTRRNPYVFMWRIKEALVTAFSTASSSATIPVTMEACYKHGGCSRRSSEFVIPLGATINMDGTALYEAVAVVFMFQAFGVQLGVAQLAIVAITATLAAVGAAGIPSAGLVTMVIVVEAVNKSLGDAVPHLPLAAVGIILGVDRILDMTRTMVNVWGDAVGAAVISKIVPDEADAAPTMAGAPVPVGGDKA